MTVKRRKKDPAVKAARKTEAYARAVVIAHSEPGDERTLHDISCAEVEGSGSCTCDPITVVVGEKAQA